MRLRTYAYDTPITGVGTTYDTADAAPVQLDAGDLRDGSSIPQRLSSLRIEVSSISSATALSIRLCRDADLDYAIVPEIEAVSIVAGVTASTVGSVAILLDDVAGIPVSSTGILYVAVLTDTGTVTIDRVEVVTVEP